VANYQTSFGYKLMNGCPVSRFRFAMH